MNCGVEQANDLWTFPHILTDAYTCEYQYTPVLPPGTNSTKTYLFANWGMYGTFRYEANMTAILGGSYLNAYNRTTHNAIARPTHGESRGR